jgi:hypothetical protein
MASIYDKPMRTLLRDMLTAWDLKRGQVFTKQRALAWFAENYPKLRASNINPHLLRASTNSASRLHFQGVDESDDLLFKVGRGEYRLFDPAHDPAPIRELVAGDVARQDAEILSEDGDADIEPDDDGDGDGDGEGEGEGEGVRGGGGRAGARQVGGRTDFRNDFRTDSRNEPSSNTTEFLLERDLQLFLAKHLDRIEPGLKLYVDEEGSGVSALEFDAGGGRRIDILATDAAGGLVVIELKVSKGYDRVVGQLLRYVNWVKLNLAQKGQRVRGIIICRTMTDDLRLACAGIADVELYEYQMSVSVSRVAAMEL